MKKVSPIIAEFFKHHRVRAEMSVESVAEYLSTSVNDVMAFENGDKPVPLETVYAISNFLSIPPSEIMSLLYGIVTEDDQIVEESVKVSGRK
ncbi:MAG: helix-turn-helix transcriptional regulator [Bdellovibrionota bacterium]